MAYPKYAVGEVVILQSKVYPQFNGEYTVFQILNPVDDHKCRLNEGTTLHFKHASGGYGYLFEEPMADPEDGFEICWGEGALRKKHQPGEMGFHELMASLTSPKLLTHNPDGVVAAPPV